MRIVVVGDGKVGFTLTERLAAEGHDLVVIDTNSRTLAALSNALDVITIQGNGASYRIQKEAGVERCDLLIAVTSMDEINIVCCMVAKKLGAGHTIARVRNPDYVEQLVFLRDELGLSMAVNPEWSAALEIARSLRYPSAIKVETFARSRADLIEYRIPEGSVLDGKPLHKIREALKLRPLVCAVRRGDEVHIPSGDFILQAGDHIHVNLPPSEITAFFKRLGVSSHSVKDVMIVGGGRMAYYLAREMLEAGAQVKIIERDGTVAGNLCERLPHALVIQGDGTDTNLLAEEGLDNVGAFVSLTGMDEENILLSLYARTRTKGKIVAKVDRVAFLSVLDNLGLDSFISPKSIAADTIVRFVRAMENAGSSNIETLHRMVGGRVEGLEFHVKSEAAHLGKPLRELPLKPDLLIGSIARQGRIIIPQGSDTIEAGDRVVVITAGRTLNEYNDIFIA